MKINILTPLRKGGPYFIGEQLTKELRKRGIEAKHIHRLFGLLSSPFYQKCDIVHSMDIPITFRLWKKPLILTIHGEYPIQKNIWRYFFPLAIKKATAITTVSRFLKKKLNLKKTVIIPNAIDINKFKPIKYKEKKEINIITVTKFYFKDKAYGVLKLIKILEKTSKRIDKTINYIIVGGGKYLSEIKNKVRQCKMNVNFTGFIKNPGKVLERSDIFIYYSEHDNLPVTILEAMACGLPVVTNDIGAVGEIINNKKDGFITSNEEEYTNYLIQLINNYKLREKIGIAARKKVEEKFNWENQINQWLRIYSQYIPKNFDEKEND